MIGPVGSGAHDIHFSTPEAQLAVLVLENQDLEQRIDQQTLDQARRSFVEHSAAQIRAMRKEAEHIARGALLEAGAIATGAALDGAGAYCAATAPAGAKVPEADYLHGAGQTWSGGVPSVLGKFVGDSPAARDRADAKQAELAAKQDEWQLDDRKDAIQKSQGQQQQAIEWLSKLVDTEAAAGQAVLSSLA